MWAPLLSERRTRLIGAALACVLLVSLLLWPRGHGRRRLAQLETEFMGGLPGFIVLENVWFRNQTFHLYNPIAPMPRKDELLSGPVELIVHRSVPFPKRAHTYLDGTTLFLNEGAREGWNGLWHYYHFAAENILGGLAALAAAAPSWRDVELGEQPEPEYDFVPGRLMIPWEGGWRDRWGMNEMVVRGMFDKFIDRGPWLNLIGNGDRWLFFERVIIVDRWASHLHNPAADQWNKMALPVFDILHRKHFWVPARKKLLDHLNIRPMAREALKIVYIDRQSTDRHIQEEDHVELMSLFRAINETGEVLVDHVVLENMTITAQVEAVADATVMIGIHGNGLTHQMWMPERSALIELFPPTSFLRDYQTVAAVLGHRYIAVRNDTALTPVDWEGTGEQNPWGLHDGTEVALHVPIFRDILSSLLENYGVYI